METPTWGEMVRTGVAAVDWRASPVQKSLNSGVSLAVSKMTHGHGLSWDTGSRPPLHFTVRKLRSRGGSCLPKMGPISFLTRIQGARGNLSCNLWRQRGLPDLPALGCFISSIGPHPVWRKQTPPEYRALLFRALSQPRSRLQDSPSVHCFSSEYLPLWRSTSSAHLPVVGNLYLLGFFPP